jgi:hypothetical protein
MLCTSNCGGSYLDFRACSESSQLRICRCDGRCRGDNDSAVMLTGSPIRDVHPGQSGIKLRERKGFNDNLIRYSYGSLPSGRAGTNDISGT